MPARSTLTLALLLVLAITHVQIWWGAGSRGSVERLRGQLNTQQAANAVLQQENERLRSEVQDLREGTEMIEEKARSELGMIRANEIFVQIVER